jgi:hypothetical protein
MSDELQRLIAAERAAPPEPPVGSASAGWERLKGSAIVVVPPAFDVPPPIVETLAVAKTGAGLGIFGKVIATVAVATATTTTAIVVTRSEPAKAPVVARAVEADPPRVEPVPVREPVPSTPAAPPPVAPPPVEVAIAAPPVVAPAPIEIAAGERLRKPRPATTPAAAPPSDDDADDGKLERERALVSAAQRALAEKRPARALDVLDDHAGTFPHGAMAEDRDALRVVALCLAGRTADADASRTKFFRRWPKSLHASRVRKACDEHG